MAMSRTKVLYALSGLTVALIAGTIWITPAPVGENAAPGARLFSDLDVKTINTAASLDVTAKGKTFTIYKKDGTWVVKEVSDYPADTALVRKALFALTELRPYEAKTNDPKRLDKLDLEDPKSKDAQSKRLTVKDKDGKVLADLIVGKSNTTNIILGKEMVYVRKAGDNQAWLAEGDPSLKDTALDWIDRKVIDVAVARVADVETKDAKGGDILHLAKAKPEDKDYAIKNIPADWKPKEARTISYVAESLDGVSLDDVKKASDIDFTKNAAGTGTWRTFDGLVIKVRMANQDKKFWATISAEVDEGAVLKQKPKPGSKLLAADAVRKEAAEINSRVSGWAYNLPSTSSRFMQYKMTDIADAPKKKDEKKPEEKRKSDAKTPAAPKKAEAKPAGPAPAAEQKAAEKKADGKKTEDKKAETKTEEKKAGEKAMAKAAPAAAPGTADVKPAVPKKVPPPAFGGPH
jgi:hypothetical protein